MPFQNFKVFHWFFSILIVFGLTPLALAEYELSEVKANTESPHAFLASAGFTKGGFGVGLDYENSFHRTFGLGGYLRIYGDNSKANQGEITAFGGFIRPHFTRQSWDFYVSPGFGFFQEDINGSNESMVGPVLMVGLLYQISEMMAVGAENMQIYGWFGDDKALGQRSDEVMVRFRYSF